ncbi:MAG: hypothetical protein RR642_09935 [Solibacillus sp.]
MTSLNNVSLTQNIWQQLLWKCRTFSSTFTTVLIVQIIFSVLSFGSSGSRGGSFGAIQYNESVYSLDFLVIISIFSAIMLGWLLATQSIRNDNFSVVTTNFTETVSTLLFLVVLSAFTVFSALSSLYITVFTRLLFFDQVMVFKSIFIDISTLFIFSFFVLIAGSASFFAKTLFDISKITFLLLTIAIIYSVRTWGISESAFFEFILVQSMGELLGKVLLVLTILWGLTIVIRKRREVIRR